MIAVGSIFYRQLSQYIDNDSGQLGYEKDYPVLGLSNLCCAIHFCFFLIRQEFLQHSRLDNSVLIRKVRVLIPTLTIFLILLLRF